MIDVYDGYERQERATAAGFLLWHYTDWDGFTNILHTDELWASDYRVMNDAMEFRHALEFSKDRYAGRLESVETFINTAIDGDITDLPAACVLSTSKAFDSLEQWRAYSRGSVGVALGFDSGGLQGSLESLYGFHKLDCLYESEPKSAVIRAHWKRATEAERSQQQRIDKTTSEGAHAGTLNYLEKQKGWMYLEEQRDFLWDIALRFKDQSFAHEEEVRFVSGFEGMSQLPRRAHPQKPAVKAFRRRGSLIVPYYPLSLKQEEMEHPLRSVLIGPSAEPAMLAQQYAYIEEWLRERCNKKASVAISRRALRPWI